MRVYQDRENTKEGTWEATDIKEGEDKTYVCHLLRLKFLWGPQTDALLKRMHGLGFLGTSGLEMWLRGSVIMHRAWRTRHSNQETQRQGQTDTPLIMGWGGDGERKEMLTRIYWKGCQLQVYVFCLILFLKKADYLYRAMLKRGFHSRNRKGSYCFHSFLYFAVCPSDS